MVCTVCRCVYTGWRCSEGFKSCDVMWVVCLTKPLVGCCVCVGFLEGWCGEPWDGHSGIRFLLDQLRNSRFLGQGRRDSMDCRNYTSSEHQQVCGREIVSEFCVGCVVAFCLCFWMAILAGYTFLWSASNWYSVMQTFVWSRTCCLF